MYQKQLYRDNQLTPLSLRNLGFQQAHISSLPKSLYEIDFKHTQSCWRDALNISLQSFYKLQGLLIDARTQKKWKFYNIIICSAKDRVSSITQTQLRNSIISKRTNWRVNHFQTIIISLQMDKNQQFSELCNFGGQNWTVYQSNFQTLSQCLSLVFDKFIRSDKKMSLMDSQVGQENFGLIKEEYLGIGLSIDSSIKMINKWQNLINKIGRSIEKLSINDVVLGIIFNKKPWVVAKHSKLQFQSSIQKNFIHQQNPYIIPQQQNPPLIPQYQNPPVIPQYQNHPQNRQNQNNYAQLQHAPPPQRGNGCAKCCCYIILSLFISFMIRVIIYASVK